MSGGCLILLFAIVSSVTCFAGEIVDRIERTYSTKERPLIYVRNSDGRVTMRATPGSEVRVVAVKEVTRESSAGEGRRQASRIEVRIEQIGNRIEVEARYPKLMGVWDHDTQVLVHFEVSGPAASDVDARSSDGPLNVEGFSGHIELFTSDGRLEASNCSGRINARVSDGQMKITAAHGELEARTSDGSMTLDGTFNALDVKSSDGSVDITVRPGSVMERAWTINSSDGSVRMRLPEDFGADLDISTSDGSIRVDPPVTLSGGALSKNHMVGKLNKGGSSLRIHTSDGSVTISK
jgi:hypothetical protein